MHIPETAHLWTLFLAGHTLHVMKRAGLSVSSKISGTESRAQWLRTNALNLAIRLFVNAAGFSYWLAHPDAATHVIRTLGIPFDLTIEPGHAAAAMSASPATPWSTGPPRKSRSCKKKSPPRPNKRIGILHER
ncbi:MAG TPA: hypothetical protein VEJ38_09870 [Candidatus Acidoferrales bacterium]|nr:hypothetical protein [Candidatus Acidoferrales bacterium]